MKIAQVSPLFESVPPKLYGGTERIVSYLTEALVKAGHDVTLFASGDSVTSAKLQSPCARSLRLHSTSCDPHIEHNLGFEMVMNQAANFDVIHFHTEWMHFGVSRRSPIPSVTTLHGRLDLKEYRALFAEFSEQRLISISRSQASPLPAANWLGVVHHGLPVDHLKYSPRDDGYLAFLGRISPEKRVDRAVEIARRSGLKLKVAAKIDAHDIKYVDGISHCLRDPHVEFIGEIDDSRKSAFLGGARALLFPIDWPEPFGLVMIEALACGTPVIAFRNGAAPEVVGHGVTGYIVDDIDQAIRAVDAIDRIDRGICRQEFERRFTSDRMARDYVALYEKLLAESAINAKASFLRPTFTEFAAPTGGLH